jgi:hypothetical protein
MQIRTYRYPSTREFELNLVGNVWQFRIGTHQIAIWRHLRPIINLHRRRRIHAVRAG